MFVSYQRSKGVGLKKGWRRVDAARGGGGGGGIKTLKFGFLAMSR